MTTSNSRKADHPIDTKFLDRWSPRAYTGEAIPDATLKIILEAARWAPSSYNSQPWRFLYAKRDTADWERFLGLLNDANRSWAKNAAVLVILVSSKTMMVPGKTEPVPSRTHSLDSGAAWAYLALQASQSGWDAHGMIGFDVERARSELKVPDGFEVEIAITIGKRGDASILPSPFKERESPNARKPLAEQAFEGNFPAA